MQGPGQQDWRWLSLQVVTTVAQGWLFLWGLCSLLIFFFLFKEFVLQNLCGRLCGHPRWQSHAVQGMC